ncbi:MAG: hypothetical protein QOG86_567 [Thermoleophilaceae bacterium]|nr:hypothetical protein [Thermoleophilaceae bacterium]
MTARMRRLSTATAIAACALCLLAPGVSAAWEQVGFPVRGTETAFRNFDLKRIGGTVYTAVADEHNIYVYRIDQNGDWAFLNVVNTRPAGDPSLAEGPGGVPWLAWTEQDADGVAQIHAGYLDQSGYYWHEPDGRDWQINYRPPPSDPNHDDTGPWYADSPRLVFLGDRPYITFLQDNPSEYQVDAVRLAKDGHSWERIGRELFSYLPRNPGAAVIDGILNVGVVGGFDSAVAGRLSQAGNWETLGSPNQSVKDDQGYPFDGPFNRITGFDGETQVLWTGRERTYVSKPTDDGSWQVVGGGPVALVGRPADIREIGGRLYVAWIGSESVPELHVSRLADDGNSWIEVDGPVGHPVSGGARLTGLDGVPYIAFTESTGYGSALKVARLAGAPAPIGPDDDGSGPGEDPPVKGVPVLPPRGSHPDPVLTPDVCGFRMQGTPGRDTLTGTSGPNTIHGLAGDDLLSGGAGSDCLLGGDGEDKLYGGAGNDSLIGGADEDLLVGGAGGDRLSGGAGWDEFRGGPGNDSIDAADGRGETVHCGRGVDHVRADRFDRVRGCEHVRVVR